jgi:adenylosuccinate lyase
MAGNEMLTEGFAQGQVGSSAMPHKMNTRSTERINGLQVVLGGYVHMLSSIAGDQWFEGDVSCSVVRRVALPDGFFAFDGMVETMLHVLDDMGAYEAVIAKDLDRYLPFLTTTTLLMESVQRGAGREQAHEAIKEHALATALAMREQGLSNNDLAGRLAADDRIPLNESEINQILSQNRNLTGMASQQVDTFVRAVNELISAFPEALSIEKARLL